MTGAAEAFPRRFRRRLAVAFLLVAAFSAGVLATGAYVGSSRYRRATFDESARRRAEVNLRLIEAEPGWRPSEELLESFRREPGSESVVVTALGVLSSDPSFGLDDVPELDGDVTSTRVAGAGYRVTHVVSERERTELFAFFSTEDLERSLDNFRDSLLIGWAVVVGLAGVIGTVVARRTLRPVQDAADAAHSLAEGLLETRLPVTTDDEFGAWAADFNLMAGALEDRIAALSLAKERERRFAADVAHELRTPLASLVASASLLEQHLDDLPATVRRPAELLVTEARRLRGLVDDLLALFRIESGQDAAHLEEIDLGASVAAVVQGFAADDVAVEVERDVRVVADRRRVDRVLANLVGNAVQHGRRDVAVRVTRRDGMGVVEVSDHGPGISAADQARLFDRFTKLDKARSGGGVGLGLAIALECARSTGGTIEVDGAVGRGTTFRFVVPAADSTANDSGVTDRGVTDRRATESGERASAVTERGVTQA